MAQEDMKEEKHLREKLQKERDTLLAEKYTLDQSILVCFQFSCDESL